MTLADEIERLQQLHASGALSEEEFAAAKQKVLNAAPGSPDASESSPVSGSTFRLSEAQWAMCLHFSMLCGVLFTGVGYVVPLLLWLLKKDDMPSLDVHGRNAMNWVLSSLIYGAGCFLLSFVIVGIPMLFALGALCVVFPIVAGIKANDGKVWGYPLSIRFLGSRED